MSSANALYAHFEEVTVTGVDILRVVVDCIFAHRCPGKEVFSCNIDLKSLEFHSLNDFLREGIIHGEVLQTKICCTLEIACIRL